MKYIVYKTTNKTNQKYYVGKHNIRDDLVDSYRGSGKILKRALEKYGRDGFDFEVLAIAETEEECYTLEEEFIGDKWKTDPLCYNMIPGGRGLTSEAWTDELRQKQSELVKQRKINDPTYGQRISDTLKERFSSDPTMKERMIGDNNPMRKMSPERKKIHAENVSKAMTGEGNPFYGRKHSEETKRKISEKRIGQPAAFKGRTHSEETKKILSEKRKGKSPWNKGLKKIASN